MIAIIKKELKSYFLSPIGWIYIGIFLIFCSLFFFTDIFRYKSSAFSDLFGITVSVLSVLIPILTMRTFAEERKNKTDQILLTAPISVREIVLEFITTINVLIGYILLSLVYISIGLFCSSLTENQIIAAVLSVGILTAFGTLPKLVISLKDYSPLDAFFNSFYNGISSLKDYILLISYILMFLLFTIIIIQRRKNIK